MRVDVGMGRCAALQLHLTETKLGVERELVLLVQQLPLPEAHTLRIIVHPNRGASLVESQHARHLMRASNTLHFCRAKAHAVRVQRPATCTSRYAFICTGCVHAHVHACGGVHRSFSHGIRVLTQTSSHLVLLGIG